MSLASLNLMCYDPERTCSHRRNRDNLMCDDYVLHQGQSSEGCLRSVTQTKNVDVTSQKRLRHRSLCNASAEQLLSPPEKHRIEHGTTEIDPKFHCFNFFADLTLMAAMKATRISPRIDE
ncbi:hypothetical protein PHSY_000132 [Pseudozyma hubeiensis SY62]|uniref:Uncharacterized protein n=1 Tax=Pseudozyma hubeiensis (strain SY62) TaxID=1305764 RepID=R9NVP2_PSEHS|nr:hypothetical protein PHSY_000132 [Pseudozyma hubeiensis SY62]GAC92578.1 hypothetical protein PHSY_000132 [Pseudozyma hubeiensis SY62]